MLKGFQRPVLLGGIAVERQPDVGVLIIRGYMDLGDGCGTHTRICEFIADKLVELFADDFTDTLVAVGVHAPSIALPGGGNNAGRES